MIFDFSVYLSCYRIPAGARLGFGCASLKVLLNHHESDDKISGCYIPLCRRMGENKACFQLTRQLTERGQINQIHPNRKPCLEQGHLQMENMDMLWWALSPATLVYPLEHHLG